MIIAHYIPSTDLCAASLVCRKWYEIFEPFLWGAPASHFGTDNDAVYGKENKALILECATLSMMLTKYKSPLLCSGGR
jgi:hypothetical protein